MRSAQVWRAGILAAVALSSATPAAAEGKVILGRDTYLRGGFVELGLIPGRSSQSLIPLNFYGVASSVEVPAGLTATFLGRGYQRLRIEGPARIDDLKRGRPGGVDWNDTIAEVRICRTGDRSCITPLFFEHVHFRGYSHDRWSDWPALKHWTDSISSLIVPEGWTVTLFEHAEYKGLSAVVKGPARIEDMKTGPREDLRRLHDKVSSIRIQGP